VAIHKSHPQDFLVVVIKYHERTLIWPFFSGGIFYPETIRVYPRDDIITVVKYT